MTVEEVGNPTSVVKLKTHSFRVETPDKRVKVFGFPWDEVSYPEWTGHLLPLVFEDPTITDIRVVDLMSSMAPATPNNIPL